MKQLVAVLMVALLIASVVIGQQAQQTPAQPSAQSQISPEEAKKLQADLLLLRQLLGTEQPAQGQPIQQQPQKSMADVLDKFLDIMKTTVASLEGAIKKAAPEVWRIMVRQQYAKAFGNLVLPWGLLIANLIFMWASKKLWILTEAEKTEKSDKMTEKDWRTLLTTFCPLMLGFIFAVWGLVNLKDSVLYLFNPEYYALRDLFMLLLNPGAM